MLMNRTIDFHKVSKDKVLPKKDYNKSEVIYHKGERILKSVNRENLDLMFSKINGVKKSKLINYEKNDKKNVKSNIDETEKKINNNNNYFNE